MFHIYVEKTNGISAVDVAASASTTVATGATTTVVVAALKGKYCTTVNINTKCC